MSAETDFENTIRICEFYADPGEVFEVDLENWLIFMGAREIDLVRDNGKLEGWLVIEPDGFSHLVDDLHSYFQDVYDWKDRD